MTSQEILEQTKQLIAIPSTHNNPQALSQALSFVASFIKEQRPNITIEHFESNGKSSFLAYRDQARPKKFKIILNGHVDVVPGEPSQYQVIEKDGKLYGRGIYDMKAACAILANVFCEFVEKVPYALGLQIVTDEESAGKNGTLHQIEQGVRSDFVICGECGRSTLTHEIANEAKGIAVIEVGFRGSAGHAAYPWKAQNAAVKALHFVNALHQHYPVPTEESQATTATVTHITTNNNAHTKIPDQAMVKLDLRFTAGDPHFKDKEHLTAHIKEFDQDAEILTYHDFSSPLYTDPQSPLLLSLKRSAEKIEGAPFSFVKRNATSDGRFYGDVNNEACEFGIAGEHQHGHGEYITLQAFNNYLDTMRDFLANTIG
ncbi:MAG TPA: M20 family metallopeptidase [Patescibacteria group bacterium]|jgi:succinyl-diaminopimelate desuccinylase|nr:M20 family metallopeptidase [Patescibacteria group bacterium]